MKKRIGYVSALVGAVLLLGSCANILSSPTIGETVPPGKGRLTVQVEDGSRTALPSGTFDHYILRFEYAGGTEGYAHEPVEWSDGISVDLEPGPWTVYVDAYVGPVVSGVGSAAVMVDAGTTTPVTIRVGINTVVEVPGTLKYTVSYPVPGHAYGTETLTVRDASGAIVEGPVTITNGYPGSLDLDPGVYFVGVVINDTELRIGVARTSAAHIYSGKETTLEIEIEEDEFTVFVPVVVTAELTVSTGLTVGDRAVAAYRNEACTASLLDPETVSPTTGEAAIILWAPSADAAVYVRQEVEIGGVTYNGKPVLVSIANPEQTVAAGLADSFYKASVIPGITGGTVTAPPPIVLSGSSVAFTVTPDTNFILKSGTLKYSDGTGDHAITGSGPEYSFEMPAADVTISAFFNRVLGFTIEGPTDKAMAITVTGAEPAPAISWSADESVTFTVAGSDYTVAKENLKWMVNGDVLESAENYLTISARHYVQRSYTLTVMIKDSGQWYSREIPFEVTE